MESNAPNARLVPAPQTDVVWTDRSIRIDVEGPEKSRELTVAGPIARIGSHPRSELVLRSPGVLRRHLYCHILPEGLYCLDLQASQTNGKQTGYWVHPDRPVQVGPYRLTMSIASPKGERWNLPIPTNDGLDKLPAEHCPFVTVSREKEPIGTFRLRKALTLVGSAAGNRISIATEYLSPFHCVVYRQGDQLWLIDLLTTNHVRVGSQRIDVANIPLAGKVFMGNIVFKFRSPESAEGAIAEPSVARKGPADSEEGVLVSEGLREAGPKSIRSALIPGDSETASPPPVPDTAIAEIARLQREVAEQQNQIAQLQERHQFEWDQREKHWEQERQAWFQSKLEAEAQQAASQQALAQAREQLMAAEAEFQRKRAEHELVLQQHNAESQAQKSELERRHQQLEAEQLSQAEGLRKLLADQQALEEQRRELTRSRESLHVESQALAATRQQLEVEQLSQAEGLRKLLADQQALEEQRRELTQLRESLQAESQALAATRQQLDAEQQTLRHEQVALTEQRASLTQQDVRREETNAQKIATLENRCAELEQQLQGERETSQRQANEAEERYQLLSQQHAELQAHNERISQEGQILQKSRDALQQQAVERQADAERIRTQLEEQLAALQRQFQAERATVQQLQVQAETASLDFQRQLADWQSQCQKISQEHDELKQLLVISQQELEDRKRMAAQAQTEWQQQMSARELVWQQDRAAWERDRAAWENDTRELNQRLSTQLAQFTDESDRQFAEIQRLEQQVSQLSQTLADNSQPQDPPEEMRSRSLELEERSQQLQTLAAELNREREMLEAARAVFERESRFEQSQFQVLANLHELDVEKRWWYRLVHFFQKPKP